MHNSLLTSEMAFAPTLLLLFWNNFLTIRSFPVWKVLHPSDQHCCPCEQPSYDRSKSRMRVMLVSPAWRHDGFWCWTCMTVFEHQSINSFAKCRKRRCPLQVEECSSQNTCRKRMPPEAGREGTMKLFSRYTQYKHYRRKRILNTGLEKVSQARER